ncbi:MAG: polysaccharide pyruvyl transferase family protein, partial [Spirochaetota bacterium]|nr:polysaccharide pyruvyl transferase family protein [Spirochaetota bacterium]
MKFNSIQKISHADCTGCGACYNICPKNAIEMKLNHEGFWAPFINEKKCIDCGICSKTCPIENRKYINTSTPSCYAIKAPDEIRKESSSGGVFSLFANKILELNGYVCGAILDSDFYARHIVSNKKSEIEMMRKSKYIQSNVGASYKQIKEKLLDKKIVLFTGTPCQIAGLYNFLGSDFENLYTIDIFCHGVPAVKFFHKYLDETFGLKNVKSFNFRTKDYGYNSMNQIVELKNGKRIGRNRYFDIFEQGMHSGLFLKNICGDCPFASEPRQADISIGDFWGISSYDKNIVDPLGVSAVLINNDKGKVLFEKIKNDNTFIKEIPYSIAKNNNRLSSHMPLPKGRNWFFHMQQSQSLEKSIKYALSRKFDIGVIGLWYGRNYGSMATYYALHHILKYTFGLSVLMIENCIRNKNIEEKHPYEIAEKFYDVSLQYKIEDLRILNDFCDTFILGSDQLWNVHLSRPYKQAYFLDFVNDKNKKIAYGTSFGKTYEGTKEEALISSYNLNRFDHISVRDDLSVNTCNNIFNIKAQKVCDPAFLCNETEYENVIKNFTSPNFIASLKNENYIVAYILDPSKEKVDFLKSLAFNKKIKIKIILDELSDIWERNKQNIGEINEWIEIVPNIGLGEWLSYYKFATSIVTDSYHGLIFSIIYKKPFIVFSNPNRGAERFLSLLTEIKLENRLFSNPLVAMEQINLLNSIDYKS